MFPQSQMPNLSNATSTETTVANGEDVQEFTVDPNQKVEVADPSKDINVTPPPPKAGNYIVQWELGEKGIEMKANKQGTYLVVPLVGYIILEGSEYHGYKVQDWLTSIYSTLKQNTAAHDFLYKIGVKVEHALSLKELQALLEETLAKKPVGTALIEWRLQEKNPSDPRADKKSGYVTLANRMDMFPRLPDGSRQNFVQSKLDGSTLYAQAYVAAHIKG